MKITLNNIKDILKARKAYKNSKNVETLEVDPSWLKLFLNQDNSEICKKIIYSYDEEKEINKDEDSMYLLDFDYFTDPFSLILDAVNNEQFKIKWKKEFGEITEENVIKIWNKYDGMLKKMTLLGRPSPFLETSHHYLFDMGKEDWVNLKDRDGKPMLVIEE
jgi:hypothetical protein